ncbi:MAG: hypothetical protein RL213_2033 [Bacteroidota bacterium]|jgi:hypothetical protein
MLRFIHLTMFTAVLLGCLTAPASASVLLGRPTDQSITANVLFDQATEFYLEYGLQTGVYPSQSATFLNAAGVPREVTLTGLFPNTRYYYRLRSRSVGSSTFAASPEYTFHTQRPAGSTFTFTIEADEHLYDKKGVESLYRICLDNQALDHPDFMLSLGDIFGDDHRPDSITSGELDTLHRNYRPFLDRICHSVPFYVCLGNHEGENDYYLAQNPPNNLAVWGTQWRQYYYPNPEPSAFYSGNTTFEPFGIGYPENYYAWQWGDALFVVLDVYRDQCDTSPKPKNWNWSLGQQQYQWLEQTLDTSNAAFKFVFAHHVRGQGRGGVTNARLFEWGGYEQDGVTYTFPQKRPGWTAPIHQLFVNHGVNVFFQGHDHVFAHEVLDGVTYQAMPMACDSTYEIGMLANADAYVSDTLDGSGHLRVTVDPTCTTVEYIRAYLPADTLSGLHHNREVAFTYSVGNCLTSASHSDLFDEMELYPNPADGSVRFRLPEGVPFSHFVLSDVFGKTVAETNYPGIELSSLPSGIYFVTAYFADAAIKRKLIVRH